MFPVFLVEPDTSIKRRSHADVLLHAKTQIHPDLQDIKDGLKRLRDHSVSCQKQLVDAVMMKLSMLPDVKVVFARDTDQAVQTIGEITDGPMIAVNKSSVISKEIVPALTAKGYDVVETYDDDLKIRQTRFKNPWQLPQIGPATLFNSVAVSGRLGILRKASIEKQGGKNFTGLLGVSAVSAWEGAVLFLQHSGNIRKVFEQARQIILVAGLDKIVKDLRDALFQLQCMAAFGLGPLLLGIHEKTNKTEKIDDLPFAVPLEQIGKKIHLILLDNGRSRVIEGPYKALLECIGCRACMRDCAASRLKENPGRWSPKEYAHFLVMGKNPVERFCLQCKTCRANCPLDIDLPAIMLEAGKSSGRGGLSPLNDAWLGNMGTLEKWGSRAPVIFNALANARPIRWVAEKTLDINKEIRFPRVSRNTFERWFHSGGSES